MQPRLGPQGLLVGALIGAAIANLVQFTSIDRAIGGIYDAVSVYGDRSMAAIGLVHSRSVPARFGLVLQIGALAPGARVTLGGVDLPRPEELYGLGRASSVTASEPLQDPPDLERIVIDAEAVGSGEDRDLGPYTIAVTTMPSELVFYPSGDRLWVIDAALLHPGVGEADG